MKFDLAFTHIGVLQKKYPMISSFIWVSVVHLGVLLTLCFQWAPAKKIEQPLRIKSISLKAPSPRPINQVIAPSKTSPSSSTKASASVASPKSSDKRAQKPESAPAKALKVENQPSPGVKISSPNSIKAAKSLPSKPSITSTQKDPKHSPATSAARMQNSARTQSVKDAVESLQAVEFTSSVLGSTRFNGGSNQQEEIASYEQLVADFLHTWIRLPEYGSVTIHIFLNQQGQVTRLQTLDSKSERNRHFVEERIKQLIFPVVENAFTGQAEWSRVLVLSNE